MVGDCNVFELNPKHDYRRNSCARICREFNPNFFTYLIDGEADVIRKIVTELNNLISQYALTSKTIDQSIFQ